VEITEEYKIHLLRKLTPYTDEIIFDRQCGFQHNISATVQLLCIDKIMEKIGIQQSSTPINRLQENISFREVSSIV
jgi:hypothetical protein